MIEEMGSIASASRISSSAASRRPVGARQDTAYQWWAVEYRGSRPMARWYSASAPIQSQSWVALTCARDVWASTEYSSWSTAHAAFDAVLVHTSAGARTP